MFVQSTRLLVLAGSAVLVALTSAAAPLAAQTSIRLLGASTTGTGGKAPTLWPQTTPRPGAKGFGLTIENGLPNASAVAFVSLASANVNLGGVAVNIDFNQSLQLPFVKLDAQGAFRYPAPIPNNPSLVGAQVYAQAFVADAGGAPLGFSGTAAVHLVLERIGLLLGSRSIGGTGDPQMSVNLDTGQVTLFGSTNVDNGNDFEFTQQRTHCMVPASLSKNISLFDCQVFPPAFVKSVPAQQIPWSITMHPDGIRAYVVNQGPANSNPEVQVIWALPTALTFGQAYPGPVIKLGSTIDALKMEFALNGSMGILGTLGLFGGGADLRRYDTVTSSTTYHQQQANLQFPNQFMFSFLVLNDGITIAAAMAPLGQAGQIALVNAITMTAIDIDTQSQGIQHIGTEVVGPRTPIGRVVNDMVQDPRGKFLYVANTENVNSTIINSVLKIVIDRSDPAFGTWTKTVWPTGANIMGLALSDAGDLLYVAAGNVTEVDTATMQTVRTFNVTSVNRLAVR